MDDDARSQSTTAAATSGARTMWDRVRQLQRADRADVRTTLTAVRVGGTPAGAPTATRPKDARFPSAHLAATRRMLLSAAAAARADDASEGPHVRRWLSAQAGARALRRHESLRGPMLEGELLTKTFRVFDADGEGTTPGHGYATGCAR